MGAAAALLGRPLIPWQSLLARGAGTLEGPGRFRYNYVIVIVPRRAGKTLVALAFALALMRRLTFSKAFYASHRRETAAAMWRDDWFPWIETSPLHPRHVQLRRANGSESIRFRHNRSVMRLLPPRGDAMRSFASNLALIDEGREFDLIAGEEFERAAMPTQATGRGGQFWILSNAGTSASTWLAKWRDLGRASVADPGSRIFYLEYGAPPDADLAAVETWIAAHPGIGYHVLLERLVADFEVMTADDFNAEYLGVWPDAQIDAALVNAFVAAGDQIARVLDPVTFGLELSTDRTRAVVVAVGADRRGGCAVELLEDRPHGPWLIERLAELIRVHRPHALVWDAGGPVGALAPDLANLPVNLRPLNTRDVTAGAGALHDATLAGAVHHRGDPVMLAAVTAARQRTAGGSWLYDRRAPESLPWLATAAARWIWSQGGIRGPNVA